jgi:hypothetical protein
MSIELAKCIRRLLTAANATTAQTAYFYREAKHRDVITVALIIAEVNGVPAADVMAVV